MLRFHFIGRLYLYRNPGIPDNCIHLYPGISPPVGKFLLSPEIPEPCYYLLYHKMLESMAELCRTWFEGCTPCEVIHYTYIEIIETRGLHESPFQGFCICRNFVADQSIIQYLEILFHRIGAYAAIGGDILVVQYLPVHYCRHLDKTAESIQVPHESLFHDLLFYIDLNITFKPVSGILDHIMSGYHPVGDSTDKIEIRHLRTDKRIKRQWNCSSSQSIAGTFLQLPCT